MHERDFTATVAATVTEAVDESATPFEDAKAYGQAVANAITHLTRLKVERHCACICFGAVQVGTDSFERADYLRRRFENEIGHYGRVLATLFDEPTCAHITARADERAGALLAPIYAATGRDR